MIVLCRHIKLFVFSNNNISTTTHIKRYSNTGSNFLLLTSNDINKFQGVNTFPKLTWTTFFHLSNKKKKRKQKHSAVLENGPRLLDRPSKQTKQRKGLTN